MQGRLQGELLDPQTLHWSSDSYHYEKTVRSICGLVPAAVQLVHLADAANCTECFECCINDTVLSSHIFAFTLRH